MSFVLGKNIHMSIYGKSHSDVIGAIVEGLPSGFEVDEDNLASVMARRAPGVFCGSTSRKESDKVSVLKEGSALKLEIKNNDCRPADYEKIKTIPRPMHADFPSWVRYGEIMSGGGFFSGRMTAPMCAAGAVCSQIVKEHGIEVGAHLLSVGTVCDASFDPANVSAAQLDAIRRADFPVIDENAGKLMQKAILDAASAKDSVGGVVEGCVSGLPPGFGGIMFDSLESQIAGALFAIPGVKGVEFGSGFSGARMSGSGHNDQFCIDSAGNVRTVTNNHGGILGGLATGMPLILRVAFKPTPSIGIKQRSVDLATMKEVDLEIAGRHDACIATRGLCCVESLLHIVIADNILGGL